MRNAGSPWFTALRDPRCQMQRGSSLYEVVFGVFASTLPPNAAPLAAALGLGVREVEHLLEPTLNRPGDIGRSPLRTHHVLNRLCNSPAGTTSLCTQPVISVSVMKRRT